MVVPTIGGTCPRFLVKNAAASIERVWFAQTHLMETNWPFFYLVENRPTLVKLDVSAPPGTPVPTISVTATFADGRSELRWMRAPASLPADVDLRPQPLSQDLSTSYAATLPASWLQKGVSLRFGDAGGPSITKSASDLKIASRPELNLVVADVLLFTDTIPVSRSADFGPELASKLPVSRLTIQPLPYPLRLPRLVVAPRTDSVSPFGDPVETSAMWVDKKAACTASMKTAGTCTPHSRWAVWEAVLDLTRALQAANGMSETSFWYGVMPDASNVTAWWSGGTASLANDFGKNFMHENGHSMGLPHLGGVTGTRQSSSTGLRHPYVGENIRTDGQFLGGGVGPHLCLGSAGQRHGATHLHGHGCRKAGSDAARGLRDGSPEPAPGSLFRHLHLQVAALSEWSPTGRERHRSVLQRLARRNQRRCVCADVLPVAG